MRNKLIILTFACFFGFASFSQEVGSNDKKTEISIYPNPAVEFIMVQINGDSKPEFVLNSMIGNRLQIKPEEMGGGKYKIPVKDLATGYYFLVVKDEEKRFKKAFKFLKH